MIITEKILASEKLLNFNNLLISDQVNHPSDLIESHNNTKDDVLDSLTKLFFNAYISIYQKNFNKAKSLNKQVQEIISKFELTIFSIDLNLLKAEINLKTYKFSDALNNLNKIKSKLFNSDKENFCYFAIRRVWFLQIEGLLFIELNEPDKSMISFNEGLKISQDNLFENKSYEFLINIAKLARFLGKYNLGIDIINQALSKSNDLNDDIKKVYCYAILGSIESESGHLTSSIECNSKGLELARQINAPNLYSILANSGIAYIEAGYLDKALPLLFESRQILLKINDKRLLVPLNINVGSCYFSKGDYDSALKYYTNALELIEKTNYSVKLPKVYLNLGCLYFEEDNFTLAEAYFLQCLEANEKSNDFHVTSKVLFNLILLYSAWDNIDGCLYIKNKLDQFNNSDSEIGTKIRYNIATAIIMALDNDLDQMKIAKKKLEKILNMTDIDIYDSLTSYQQYVKIVYKLFTHHNIKINWNEIFKHLYHLKAGCIKFNAYSTIYFCDILLSKVFLLQDNINEAEKLIRNVIYETKERGFDYSLKLALETLDNILSVKIALENFPDSRVAYKMNNKELEKEIINFIINN